MFPLRHGALFVVFCAEPACFVKNIHLLLCIFAAAPSWGAWIEIGNVVEYFFRWVRRAPSRGAWIEIIVDNSRYTWYT